MTDSSNDNVAVREGVEPSIRYRIHTFQACSFSHSDTSPVADEIEVGVPLSTERYFTQKVKMGQVKKYLMVTDAYLLANLFFFYEIPLGRSLPLLFAVKFLCHSMAMPAKINLDRLGVILGN